MIWRERRQETVPDILYFFILCKGGDISSKGPFATVLLESKHVRD
jgi:hypothetical protein